MVKSGLPALCERRTRGGGVVKKSMSSANRQPPPAHTPPAQGAFEREMTGSGAARNMGLMRRSRTALLSAFHTRARNGSSRLACRNIASRSPPQLPPPPPPIFIPIPPSMASSSPLFPRSCKFFLQMLINAHTGTQKASPLSLAPTSIILRSSSLCSPSPLAMRSFINHHAAP